MCNVTTGSVENLFITQKTFKRVGKVVYVT